MSTKNPPGLKHEGSHEPRDALDALDRPRTLGTDTTGAVHHYSPFDDRAVVVDADGRIEQRISTDGRRLSAYVAFVADRRGWADLRYRESFGEILHEALE